MDFYEYTKKQWDSAQTCEDSVARKRIWRAVRRSIIRRNLLHWRYLPWSIAAVASVVCFILLWHDRTSGNASSSIVEKTHVAQSCERLVLPDGSSVWLEKGSSICYNDGDDFLREVSLEGDATFDIVKCEDGSRFIVNLPESYIEVRGTTFTVNKAADESLSVVLYAGAIDFISKETGQSVSMKPSDCLIYDRQDSSMHLASFFDDITWDAGYYFVDDASLADLAGFLSWKYSQSVSISDDSCRTLKVNGRISHSEPLENVLGNICYMLNLTYSNAGNGYVIQKD